MTHDAQPRTTWRRFAETRGWLGGLEVPHRTVTLMTLDGVRLHAALVAPASAEVTAAIVVAHGFAAQHRKPAYARLVAHLAGTGAAVLSLDLRGHGRSAGRCTFGDREALDVGGAVAWLRAAGAAHVTAVGTSMGATAVLGAAAGTDGATPPDAVVTVSAPARYRHPPDTEPLRRLHGLWTSPWRRAAVRAAIGVHLDGPAGWRDPDDPVVLARRAAPRPLLAVHGADDAYFPATDADELVAAHGRGVVWHEPAGFGHAEDGFLPAFCDRLAAAVDVVRRGGRFPPR